MGNFLTYTVEVVDYGYHRGVYKRSTPIRLEADEGMSDPLIDLVGFASADEGLTYRDRATGVDNPTFSLNGDRVYSRRHVTHELHVGGEWPTVDWKSWADIKGTEGFMIFEYNDSGRPQFHFAKMGAKLSEYPTGHTLPVLALHQQWPSEEEHRVLYISHQKSGLVDFERYGWYDLYSPEMNVIRFSTPVSLGITEEEMKIVGPDQVRMWLDTSTKTLFFTVSDAHLNVYQGKLALN